MIAAAYAVFGRVPECCSTSSEYPTGANGPLKAPCLRQFFSCRPGNGALTDLTVTKGSDTWSS